MNRFRPIVFIFLALIILSPRAFCQVEEKDKEALRAVKKFAEKVLNGNRGILNLDSQQTIAELKKRKSLNAFSPDFSLNYDGSKSANRSYNSITGLEEDYSTRRRSNTASLNQKTVFGDLGLNYSGSKTEFTSSQASYFESMFLSLQTGILRRNFRINKLERRLAHLTFKIETARNDAVLMDVLLEGFQGLFNRILSEKNAFQKKENLDFYATLVEEAKIKLKNGMGSELDLKQSDMRLNQALTGQEETTLQLKEYDRRLKLLFGEEKWDSELASFSLDLIVDAIPEELDPKKMIKTAFEKRPDFIAATNETKLQETALNIGKENKKPDLSAVLSWGKQGRSTQKSLASDMRDKNWNLAIVYNTKIGPDNQKIDFRIERERLKNLRRNLKQKEEEIKVAIIRGIDNLIFFRKNLESLKASSRLSSEVLEGQRLNFQLGRISLLDLSRYQQEADSAKIAVVNGETQLIMSWLRLKYETGELLELFLPENKKKYVKNLSGENFEIVPVEIGDEGSEISN